jgi:formate C-acetyltransferase
MDDNVGRGMRIWNALRDRRDTEPVSFERAYLVTASYRETEGLPTVLRRAYALKKVLNEIPIYIDDEQLLVADFGSRPMAAECFPDLSAGWILENLDESTSLYNFGDQINDDLIEMSRYWENKSAKDVFYRSLGKEEEAQLREYSELGSWVFAASTEVQTGKGWNVADFSRGIDLGYAGLIRQVEEALSGHRVVDAPSMYKKNFLDALKIMLEAGVSYAHRYAALARAQAKTASAARRKELLEIAESCDHVPEYPARTFREAVQCMHMTHVIAFWDTMFSGLSFGRVDQFLYPYYKRDIETGVLDRERAIEILECFRVKQSSKRNFFNAAAKKALSGEVHLHNCTLAGVDRYGNDAVNALSYVWLDAAERCRVAHPTLSIRWHPRLDPDFAMRALEVCKLGLGFPAWFGDRASIDYMLMHGVSLDEARDYAFGGCVLHTLPGKTPSTFPSVMNVAKILELTVHDGKDPLREDRRIGMNTGFLWDFTDYEAFYEAFLAQLRHFIGISTAHLNRVRVSRNETFPDLFISAFFDDCIKKGDSVTGSGPRYQINAQYLLSVGVIDAANSLAAIRKCVFEDRSVSAKEFVEALRANFFGFAALHKKVLKAPKFGNDDDYVDMIAADLYRFLHETMTATDGAFGSKYEESPHSLSWHGSAGMKVGALPSGRLANVALADGAVSPCQGTDVNGPSAVINSAGKIDQTPICGALFNMKFLPSALKTDADMRKLLSLIHTYFNDYGGKHIQFNVVDRETLIEARNNPKEYRNLVIRVSGYSALFVELNSTIQDEVILRTENTL